MLTQQQINRLQNKFNERIEIKNKKPKMPQICLKTNPRDIRDLEFFKAEKIKDKSMKKRRVGGKTSYKRGNKI